MKEVYIKDYKRTAFGKSKGGMYRNIDAIQLGHAVAKSGIYDEIVFGCVQQFGEQGYNIARQISLLSRSLKNTPAITLNRLCGSSMSAAHYAYANIRAGIGTEYLVGGVEHMGHNPMTAHYYDAPMLSRHMAKGSASMGLTAEGLAKAYKISREEQDELAFRSHRRAFKHNTPNIYNLNGHDEFGHLKLALYDECVRPETSLEDYAKLKPSFDPRGTVTAGNSSAISDGAASMVLSAASIGAKYKIKDISVVTCSPATMGLGPVYAVQKLLQKNWLKVKDISAWELNEAFAAQTIACMRELGLDYGQVNKFGGAIALGHPLGASGVRILGTLTNVMDTMDGKYGIATMCIGMGQGIATLIERV